MEWRTELTISRYKQFLSGTTHISSAYLALPKIFLRLCIHRAVDASIILQNLVCSTLNCDTIKLVFRWLGSWWTILTCTITQNILSNITCRSNTSIGVYVYNCVIFTRNTKAFSSEPLIRLTSYTSAISSVLRRN